jgi:hypothetical protein
VEQEAYEVLHLRKRGTAKISGALWTPLKRRWHEGVFAVLLWITRSRCAGICLGAFFVLLLAIAPIGAQGNQLGKSWSSLLVQLPPCQIVCSFLLSQTCRAQGSQPEGRIASSATYYGWQPSGTMKVVSWGWLRWSRSQEIGPWQMHGKSTGCWWQGSRSYVMNSA